MVLCGLDRTTDAVWGQPTLAVLLGNHLSCLRVHKHTVHLLSVMPAASSAGLKQHLFCGAEGYRPLLLMRAGQGVALLRVGLRTAANAESKAGMKKESSSIGTDTVVEDSVKSLACGL